MNTQQTGPVQVTIGDIVFSRGFHEVGTVVETQNELVIAEQREVIYTIPLSCIRRTSVGLVASLPYRAIIESAQEITW